MEMGKLKVENEKKKMMKLLQRGMRWIPVTERMPEEHETRVPIARLYNKTSGRLLVTVEGDDGSRGVQQGSTRDRQWKTEFYIGDVRVVAWMPFPAPYEGV